MSKQETQVEFGKRILKLRQAKGVSQRWVAKEAGISCATITFIEKGRGNPTAQILQALADVFGYTMHELWLGVGRCGDL